MRNAKLRLALLLAGVAAASPAAAQPQGEPGHLFYQGVATAVDGDTLAFDGWRVFLWGIESVERPQYCQIAGTAWECYPAAVRSLDEILALGDARCELMGEPDYIMRYLATCTINGEDIAALQVSKGFALAKRDETLDYVDEEEAARAARIGLWQGEFMLPADYRKADNIDQDRP